MKHITSTIFIFFLCINISEALAVGPYTTNGATVTDKGTGLEWQQADDGTGRYFREALTYCEELNLSGHSDWRLPNLRELESIADESFMFPSIDPVFSCESSRYWTSTTHARFTDKAWVVRFTYGHNLTWGKTSAPLGGYVRCVRGGLVKSFNFSGNLQQTPMSGSPGTTFTQSGSGFTTNSTVTLHFLNHLDQPLPPLQYPTDGNGSFTLSYTSPFDKPVGTHSWWAVDDVTGERSEMLSYWITEAEGILSQINPPVSPVVLPPMRWGNSFTGELTSEGSFDTEKETFVIVHGWNTSDSNSLPAWVKDMGKAIRNDDTLPHVSPAQGSNILYWNWQERAKTDWDEFGSISGDMFKDESCTDLDIIGIPFDQTKYSGISLARALKEELPESYSKKIHLIGHSLGSLVITYAAKSAYAHSLPYATNIDHMVYLDSPCYLGKPGQDFNKNHSDIFLENYISSFGRAYKEADVNISLDRAIPAVGVLEAHAYAHDWYYSSVTNFSKNSILHDSSTPSTTMHAGFYWWDENNRNDGKKYFRQYANYPHYQLILDTETVANGSLDDVNGLVQAISIGLKEQIEDYVTWSGKKVSVLWAKTWASANETADVVATAGHGVHNSFGFLDLTHSSTALLTIPVQIPRDANSLAFGVEFLYGKSDSTLEVFIDNKEIYHTSGEMALLEGAQLTPWLKVSEYAGTTVNLNLRFSHPENGSEGKVRIDDIIIANIEDTRSNFPWTLFLPAIFSGIEL